MARPTVYYHGTNSNRAIDALLGGEPLRNVQPQGARASRMKGAEAGLVHLSPSLCVAAKYSKSVGRIDRPSADLGDYRPTGAVFAFEPVPDAALLPDEDELGWAVRIAAEARSFGSGPQRFVERMVWNEGFAAALAGDGGLVEALEAEAAERLPGSVLGLRDPRVGATAASIARLGRTLRDRMSPELAEAVVAAGISVATADELRPVTAWEWDCFASARAGLGLPRDIEDMLPHAKELPILGAAPGSGSRR